MEVMKNGIVNGYLANVNGISYNSLILIVY